jgi:hypothetical protein
MLCYQRAGGRQIIGSSFISRGKRPPAARVSDYAAGEN